MKILLVMEEAFATTGWMCREELRSRGHEVRQFDNKRNLLPGGAATVWEYGETARRLRLSRLNDLLINARLREVAREFAPELILFAKCENLGVATLRFLRDQTSAVLINWNLDNPFHPSNTSMEHLRAMPLLDCYGTFAEHFVPVVESLGCPRVEWWPCFFDPRVHDPAIELSRPERETFGCDVVFAGNWSPEREAVLREIADYRLFVWGESWDVLPEGSPLRRCWRGRGAVGADYAKAMKGARCVVNILNLQGKGANNLRTFEVTGIGKLLITEHSVEQASRLFRDGEEIATFRNVDELRARLDHFLAHPEEAAAVAARGQQRTLREHTVRQRMDRILSVAVELGERRRVASGLRRSAASVAAS